MACPARAGRARKNPPRRASRVRDSGCCRVFARETLPASTVVSVRAEGFVVLRVVSLLRLTRFRRSCLLGAKPNHGFFDCQQPPPTKSAAYVAGHPAEALVDTRRRACRRHAPPTPVEHAIAKNAAFYALFCNSGRTRHTLRVRRGRHAGVQGDTSKRSYAMDRLGTPISRCNTPDCAKSARRTSGSRTHARCIGHAIDRATRVRPHRSDDRAERVDDLATQTKNRPLGPVFRSRFRTSQWSSSSSSSA